jgi:hypothetical protein
MHAEYMRRRSNSLNALYCPHAIEAEPQGYNMQCAVRNKATCVRCPCDTLQVSVCINGCLMSSETFD